MTRRYSFVIHKILMFVKIRLIFFILLLVAVIAGLFWISGGLRNIFGNKEETVNLPDEDTVKPWLEVINPSVFEIKDNGDKKELFTGDELSAGITIRVETGGAANIYFPDGSLARVDGDTEFSFDESSFNKNSGKLIVRINLVMGRVWSKIISLATPDSVWEVKTSTAVATVRGTAFGMEYADNKSTIIGSENKVEVSAIDPETKKAVKQAAVIVEAGKSVEIGKELAGQVASQIAMIEARKQSGAAMPAAAVAIQAKDKMIEVRDASVKMKQEWIKKAMEEDKRINEIMKEVKETKTEMKEVRNEIKKVIRDEVKARIMEQKEAIRERGAEIKNGLPMGKIISNELIGRYQNYKENPTEDNLRDLMMWVKENLPEKLPPEIMNNVPKEILEELRSFIPKDVQSAADSFLNDPNLQTQLREKWEVISNETQMRADQIIKDIDSGVAPNTTIPPEMLKPGMMIPPEMMKPGVMIPPEMLKPGAMIPPEIMKIYTEQIKVEPVISEPVKTDTTIITR